MWFLFILWIVNSLVSQNGFVNVYRIDIAGSQIGIMEGLFAVGIVYALLSSGARFANYPSARVHPVYIVVLVLSIVGFAAGVLGAIINDATAGQVLRNARNYVGFPICLYLGYRLTSNPRWARRMLYVIVISGICTSTMLMRSFFQGAETIQYKNTWNAIRTTDYVTFHAGFGSILLFYSLINRNAKLFPATLSFLLGSYCLLGQFAPMHRSDWVAVTFAYFCGLFLLPAEQRLNTLTKTVVVIPLVSLVLFAGVQIGDWATQRDYSAKVWEKIESLLPTNRKGTERKAWDSRTGSVGQELQIWLHNPLMGEGFAAQTGELERGMVNTGAYFHNGWSSVLATTGIFGFAAVVLLIGSQLVICYRLVRHPADHITEVIAFLGFCATCNMIVHVLSNIIWYPRPDILYVTLYGMIYRIRDWQPTTLALQEQTHQDQETWLYEQGLYDSEGGWLTPGRI